MKDIKTRKNNPNLEFKRRNNGGKINQNRVKTKNKIRNQINFQKYPRVKQLKIISLPRKLNQLMHLNKNKNKIFLANQKVVSKKLWKKLNRNGKLDLKNYRSRKVLNQDCLLPVEKNQAKIKKHSY